MLSVSGLQHWLSAGDERGDRKRNKMKLKEKIAVVTGAGSGIGEATARLLAREGACVFVVDRNLDAAHKVALAIQEDGFAAEACEVDVSDEEQVKNLINRVSLKAGRLDVLVNNAGFGIAGTAINTSLQDFEKILSVNVIGVFLGCKYAIPVMQRQGGGVIVNTASVGGLVGLKERVAYCASKGAVIAMTKSMALDHVRDGIRINAVAPGTIESPYFKEIFAKSPDPVALRAQLSARQPMNRLGTPEEIAKAILFLSCDDSSFATGSILTIDGGLSAA